MVVVTVRGVDLQVVFPNAFDITRANTYLRTRPTRIIADPYGAGWLFEGTHTSPDIRACLITGQSAHAWMKDEIRRMTAHVHELSNSVNAHGAVLMADGGSPRQGFVAELTREELLGMTAEFFSPLSTWRKKW
jgi:hypothetical protein